MTEYKLLIFDLDGTAVPSAENTYPRPETIASIQKARSKVFVSCATGRSLVKAKEILDAFKLTDPCIICGGSQIINPRTHKSLWQKEIPEITTQNVFRISQKYTQDIWWGKPSGYFHTEGKPVSGSALILYIMSLPKTAAKELVKELIDFDDITTHFGISWKKGFFDVLITNVEATKKHALEVLIDMLGISSREVIAVGDGPNDLPLFELAGLKVAMGNANDDMKSQADFVTKSEAENGLGFVIEKFILV